MDNWITFLGENIDLFLALFALILGIMVKYVVDYIKQKLWQQKIDRREALERAKRSKLVERNRTIFQKIDDITAPDFSDTLLEKKVSEWNVWPLYYTDKMHEKMRKLRIPE